MASTLTLVVKLAVRLGEGEGGFVTLWVQVWARGRQARVRTVQVQVVALWARCAA